MNMALLTSFIATYPAQPATAFLRAIEIETFDRVPLPHGLGLDVGCGDGKLTKIIFDRIGARRLVGIDADPNETAAAQTIGLYEKVCTCSADALPFEDGHFDFAISNSVLEHIPNVDGVLSEVGRVCKPGAKFLITVPTLGFRANLFGPLFGGDREKYLADIDARLAHCHYFDIERWRSMLSNAGFDLELCFGYLDKWECQRWETLSRLTGGLLYKLTGSRKRPIEMQRALGLRQAQNCSTWPQSVASALARVCAAGRRDTASYWADPNGLPEGEAGCLMLTAARRQAEARH